MKYLIIIATIMWGVFFYTNARAHNVEEQQLEEIQEQINDPTAMYGYFGLLGMAHLMEGNYEAAVNSFEKGNETDIYYNYFKGLALKASGQNTEAHKIFKELASFNFSDWNIAIVRNLAKKQLEKA